MSRRAPDPPRHLHGVAQEARRLGISKGWLYGEIREGRFPHRKLGSRVLIDPAESDEFLDRRAVRVEDALGRAEEDGL